MHEHQQRWDVGGVDTCVYDTGPRPGRPTIVMLHGGDPRSLANALDWSTVWDPERLDARLVAYDKPGQGLTWSDALADQEMSGPGISAHLEGVLDHVGAEQVVLIGHSRGALPVADVALRLPGRVAGLVLVASNTLAPPGPETPADFYQRAYADPPAVPTVEFARRELEMNSYGLGHIDQSLIDGRLRAARSNGWWQARPRRLQVYRDVTHPTLQALRERVLDDLERAGFGVPVLQVWGQQDVSAPVSLAHRLFDTVSARTPVCSSLVLNGSAHYVYREQPDQFMTALTGFLASTAG